MSNTIIPTLSTDGYVYDTKLKLNYLYHYFLVAEHSQSTLYINRAVSLNHLLEKYADDIPELREQVELSLQSLLSKYFDQVETIVEIKTNPTTKREDIYIAIKVTDNNTTATLKESIDIDTNRIIKQGYKETKLWEIQD